MNRIDQKFLELRGAGRKAFIAYITAGDPTLSVTEKLVNALENSGADIVELGIPFSDPLADGPTIQAASQRALKNKVNIRGVFKMVSAIREKSSLPIAFMTYFNPVFQYGIKRFTLDAAEYGVDGVIIPDLPYEEAKDIVRMGKENGVATIFLGSPTSTSMRLKNIVRISSGFIYYVSLTGVTGERSKLPKEIGQKVKSLKHITRKPVCVGFGVSNASSASRIAKISDGVIVGSAIVKIIERNLNNKNKIIQQVSNFAKTISKAVHAA